jgi:hypothetical protein
VRLVWPLKSWQPARCALGEHERGEWRSVGAFLLGFLLGVLVTLGGSATLFMVTQRMRKAEQAEEKAKDKEQKDKAAAAGVKALDTALRAYKVHHGEYPQGLAELTKANDGKAALLEGRALTDPWGRPYFYAAAQPNERTGVPLVYSQGDDPGNPAGVIRSWE